MNNRIKINLWGNEIGRLIWDKERHNSIFQYNDDLKDIPDIAPLIASPRQMRGHLIMGSEEDKFQRLPPFIADSLPDAWGDKLFDYWRLQNKIPTADINPLDKLSFIGKRGMGALEFEPDTLVRTSDEQIDIASLSALSQKIYNQREEMHILPEESITMQQLLLLGTSAGGRQSKAVIAINPETGEIRSGQIPGRKDFKYYILKFGNKERSTAELEMSYFEMARKAGIRMTDCSLLEVEGDRHFITERFDRTSGEKIHTQTLAAMNQDANSYEKLISTCQMLRLPTSATEEIFRRMVFNVLANNTDDHTKNFSFLMGKDGKWDLSPAYDLTFIFNTKGFLPEEEHCLTIRGKQQGINREDLLSFAEENRIEKPEAIIEQVASAVSEFRPLSQKNHIEAQWIGRIESYLSDNLKTICEKKNIPEQGKKTIMIGSHKVSNMHIEQAYLGNYHLIATIDGYPRRYVLRPKMAEYKEIAEKGKDNISQKRLEEMVKELLIKRKSISL
jgi:serine/threonine-protein kinase HipA